MTEPSPTTARLAALIDDFAAAAPIPAGGAAAVVAIALGAALGRKLVHRSRGDAATLATFAAELEAARATLLPELDADCAAYAAVLAALRVRDDAPGRTAAWQRATQAPLAVAQRADAILELLDRLAPHANPRMTGDLDAARALVRTGRDIAMANARENAASGGLPPP